MDKLNHNKNLKTVDKVRNCAMPIVQDLGLELWDIKFEKEGPNWFLRVIIDSDNNISMNDCENVSRALDVVLDNEDFIDKSYFLEVSSPGINRILSSYEHFQKCIGMDVKLKTIIAIDGERDFEGKLISYEDKVLEINDGAQNIKFNVNDCSYVKLNDDIDF